MSRRLLAFSPHRLAYEITLMIWLLVPAQAFVPCSGSGALGGTSLIWSGVVLLLCAMPPKRPERFTPLALAFAGVLLNGLMVH